MKPRHPLMFTERKLAYTVRYTIRMQSSFALLDFSLWYYTRAFRDILSVWLNFMWFIVHFFSIPLLLRTLFAPWRRMTDEGEHRSVESFMEAFVMNIMTRVFGAITRIIIITIGLTFLVLGVLCLFIALGLWVAMPIVILFAITRGITILVS